MPASKKNPKSKPASAAAAGAPAPPSSAILWGDADTTPPAIAALATNPKPDFRIDVFSAVADSLQVELLPDGPRNSAVAAACISAPGQLPPGRTVKGWRCDVRGYVTKPKAARGTVLVTVGLTTKAFDFGWGKAVTGNFSFRFRAREPRIAPIPGAASTPMLPLVISVQLVIQRQDAAEQFTLTVDTLDLQADVGN